METKKINKEQLKTWLEKGEDLLLLDVMNPEFFAEAHIQGAQNAPVYEIAFLDYVQKITQDKHKHIVLYDDNSQAFALEDAALKLASVGFANVEILSENLTAWINAGFPVETGTQVEIIPVKDGKHELDVEKSVFGWTGRNAKYAHHGKINLKSGFVTWEKGKLIDGEFVLDMTSIVDEDLTDPTWKVVLESHLKSSDFFDVANYPEASFRFQKIELRDQERKGAPNYQITGTLTIRDVTKSLEFPALVVPMEDGSLNGQAHFDFDRTLWNVRYGSEKFFTKLGMHLVNDLVSVEMFLVAKS